MKTFSVIVIGKNEEAHLDACLRSVLAAVEEVGEGEVVYVDSASTDRSVEVARALGVRVLALRPEWKHTPGGGRYIGFQHTTGELLMFVDGDCVLDRQWLCRALAYFTEPDVAGIAGYLSDVDAEGRATPFVGEQSLEVKTLPTLRGIAAYRRAALQEAGSFNPHLRSEEEAELALRGCVGRILHRIGHGNVDEPHLPEHGFTIKRDKDLVFNIQHRGLAQALHWHRHPPLQFGRTAP